MSKKRDKIKITEGRLALVFVILIVVAFYGFTWIATCGLIKLVTMCFGWTFKWPVATGVWLILCIAKSIFKNSK